MTRWPRLLRPLTFAAALLASPAFADYSTHPKAAELLDRLAQDHGFGAADLAAVRRALEQAQRMPNLIDKELNNKEAPQRPPGAPALPDWNGYRPIHVNDRNIERGVAFMAEHAPWFAKAEAEFGVPASVIAAVLGVETKYGGYTGPHRVLDALATQGFEHPTRSAFFFSELTEFFVFARDSGLPPTELRGSYAGAMGYAQFMPSNYRRLALDYDGDGDRDLWSAPDAIGSIANYLTHYDPSRVWQRGQPMIAAATVRGALPATLPRNGRAADQTVGALRKAGLVPVPAPSPTLPDAMPAAVVELRRGEALEYWLGLPNFFAVFTYNPRTFYAMAVAQLAEALAAAAPPPAEQMADAQP